MGSHRRDDVEGKIDVYPLVSWPVVACCTCQDAGPCSVRATPSESGREMRLCLSYKLGFFGRTFSKKESSNVVKEWTLELMIPGHFLTMCLMV